MKEDVLRRITDAEQQADQIVHDAKMQAETILHNARHQAVEARIAREETARNTARNLLKQGLTDIEQEAAAIHLRTRQEIEQDAQRANSRHEQTVAFVVAKFSEALRSEK